MVVCVKVYDICGDLVRLIPIESKVFFLSTLFMSFFNKTTSYSYVLFICMVVLVGVTSVKIYFKNNVWSIDYFKQSNNSMNAPINISIPSLDHNHAVFWIARDAINAGDNLEAINLIDSFAMAGNKEAISIMGLALEATGDYPRAVQYLKRAGDINSLLAIARRSNENNQSDNALLAFETVLELDPSRVEVIFQTAQILAKDGRYIEADYQFNKAIEIAPNNRWWYIARANAARDSGDITKSVGLYQETVSAFPDFAPAHYEMAWAYYLNEQYTKAAEAIEIAMDLIGIPDKWYYFRAGKIYDGLGEPDMTLKMYQEAVNNYPDFALGYYEIGLYYLINGRIDDAVPMIEEALRLMPSPNKWYYLRAGQIYEKVGQLDRAVYFYMEALKLDAANDIALEGLERIRMK